MSLQLQLSFILILDKSLSVSLDVTEINFLLNECLRVFIDTLITSQEYVKVKKIVFLEHIFLIKGKLLLTKLQAFYHSIFKIM